MLDTAEGGRVVGCKVVFSSNYRSPIYITPLVARELIAKGLLKCEPNGTMTCANDDLFWKALRVY